MHHAFNVLHCYHKQDAEAHTSYSVTYYFGACYTNQSFRGFLGYARNNSECYFFTHNVNLESARSGNRRQNYIKFFNSRASDCEIHIKCAEFVHYLAFGIRFRLRILVNGAVGRWATTKYSVGRGLYAPYHGLRRVAGRSHNPYERATRYSPFVFFGKK